MQAISELQHDNVALKQKMDSMDGKLSMIVSHLTGREQALQKEDINGSHGLRLHTPSVTEMPSEQQLAMEQDLPPLPGEMEDNVVPKRSGSTGEEERKRRRMEQHMVDASGVCQEPEEVIRSPAVISWAIKDLVGFQDQADLSSGDVLAPYLISGMTVDSKMK